MKRWMLTCFAMLTMLLVVASPAAAAPGGNSAAAAACQNGGYLAYTRADTTPFKNAGQCTAYAAQGNTLASAVLTFVPSSHTPGLCQPVVTVSGYEPGTWPLTFIPSPSSVSSILVDANGNGGGVGNYYYHNQQPGTSVIAVVRGMGVATAIAECD